MPTQPQPKRQRRGIGHSANPPQRSLPTKSQPKRQRGGLGISAHPPQRALPLRLRKQVQAMLRQRQPRQIHSTRSCRLKIGHRRHQYCTMKF